MAKVVILQPQFFPWLGLFEQIRLADIYVHFDDVQMPLNSTFINRVQVKGPNGQHWLSAPVNRPSGLPLIKDIEFSSAASWRKEHLNTLALFYGKAPYYREMMDLAETVYGFSGNNLANFNIHAIERISAYFGFATAFKRSSDMPNAHKSSERLLAICRSVDAHVYITGHGSKNYLDHGLFDDNGVRVEYMRYGYDPYPQFFGAFTPYVSVLDLIAHTGKSGKQWINKGTIYWKDLLGMREL